MPSILEPTPYPTADKPSDVVKLLEDGKPVVPAGPYLQCQSGGTACHPPPAPMCNLSMLDGIVSNCEKIFGRGVSLKSVSRNVVQYICAGLLKHRAFATRSRDLDIYQELKEQGEDAIKEAFKFNGMLTDAHKRWIVGEQARCVSVVTGCLEILDEACLENDSLVKAMKELKIRVEESAPEGTERDDLVRWMLTEIDTSYIDVRAYARRSTQLNTLAPRFRITAGQWENKRDLVEELKAMLSTAESKSSRKRGRAEGSLPGERKRTKGSP